MSQGPTPTNPGLQALYQSQPASEQQWDNAVTRARKLDLAASGLGLRKFSSMPSANRFSAILEAVVPSRRDPTHEKVLAVVNALLETQAIRKDEVGHMYNALLQRVSRYNSINVQNNLERLISDVREALTQKDKLDHSTQGLGSLVAFNSFLSTLPAVVERGQDNYTAFLGSLRLMVTEVPQSEVYRAGPHFYFQTNRHGSQTVNLSLAMENLQPLWGLRAPVDHRTTVSSLLTPNTRLLLLLVAPFTDAVSISRESYIGHLLTLFRETIGSTRVTERTYNEITEVSRALGDGQTENLQATLNYLLTNRARRLPEEHRLTEEEEKVLRYVQQSVSLYLMQDGYTPTSALDRAAGELSSNFYSAHRVFVNRLFDYFHRLASMAPDYFVNAMLNPHWLPPPGFYTNSFEIPEIDDGYLWDDINSSLLSSKPDMGMPPISSEPQSLSSLVSVAPGAVARDPVPRTSIDLDHLSQDSVLGPYLREVPPKNAERELDNLVNQMQRTWTPYSQERQELIRKYSRRSRPGDDSGDEGSSLGGRGRRSNNPFNHLRPQGYKGGAV